MKIHTVSSYPLGDSGPKPISETLNIGDTFRGTVLELTPREVILKLNDGTKMKATTLTPLKASVGDHLEFHVKNNKNGTLVLETLAASPTNSTPSASSSDIAKILTALDLKITPQNEEIVKAILASNINVSKSFVEEITKALNEYQTEDLTPQKAIFLIENNIPIHKDTIESLDHFLNKHMRIGESLNALTQNLSILPNHQLHELSTQLKFLEAFQEIPKLMAILSALDPSKTPTENHSPMNENIPTTSSSSDPKNLLFIENLFSKTIFPSSDSNSGSLDQFINTALSMISEESHHFINTASKESLQVLLSTIAATPASFNSDFLEKHALLLEEFLKNHETTASNQDPSPSNQPIQKEASTPPPSLQDPISKAQSMMQNIFKDSFIHLNNPSSLKELDIQNIYVKISQKLSLIQNVMKNFDSPEAMKISSAISNLDKTIHFLNLINTNQSYIELPIHYHNHQTGELYILQKKRSNKENREAGTTLFLSLQTIHLGRFETLVNVKEKQLKIYIRLEDENMINFVKNNYNLIYELIEKTEYKIVDMKCKKGTEKINPLNIEEKIREEFIEKSTSIDLKI
jgi:hypothetical protein